MHSKIHVQVPTAGLRQWKVGLTDRQSQTEIVMHKLKLFKLRSKKFEFN